MPLSSTELQGLVDQALAHGDEALTVRTLGELGRRLLEEGRTAAALRALREAARRAAALGEGSLGRALGDLGEALGAIGESALADETLLSALAHLRRAGDLAGSAEVALQRARALPGTSEVVEAAWADAARRCAAAGREADAVRAKIAAASIAVDRGDRARALTCLEELAPQLDALDELDATWARGELGALRLETGRAADALELLSRAAREEARAGRDEVATRRLHQLQLCLAMLGQST